MKEWKWKARGQDKPGQNSFFIHWIREEAFWGDVLRLSTSRILKKCFHFFFFFFSFVMSLWGDSSFSPLVITWLHNLLESDCFQRTLKSDHMMDISRVLVHGGCESKLQWFCNHRLIITRAYVILETPKGLNTPNLLRSCWH